MEPPLFSAPRPPSLSSFSHARTPTLSSHLLRDPDHAPQDAPDLPAAVRSLLASSFARRTATLTQARTSAHGGATKLLLRLQDGLEIETVIMRYDTRAAASAGCVDGGDDEDEGSPKPASSTARAATGGRRATVCVSSEVGCAMACQFCATGTMGLVGDLTGGEIVEQLDWAAAVLARGREPAPRNVVFMGMGEPLNNWPAVRAATALMTHPARWALRRSAVTISTVGVIPRLADLARDLPGVSLARSLHAPTQEGRLRIVPSARAYPLPKLMAALDAYQVATGQKVFVEYVLLAGVNDGPGDAASLAALLGSPDRPPPGLHLNLIPWNPVSAAADAGEEEAEPGAPTAPMAYAAPAPGAVEAFAATVRAAGVPVTVRAEKGQDISGACGQLVVQQAAAKGGGCGSGKAADMEDLVPGTPAS